MKSGVIKILSDSTINKIAAGEVIERPYSIVKELIENSLDSGASKIAVYLEDGGKELIKVSDNGTGILEADISLAWQRHATSKIHNADDLNHISSMGFRGEALSSIAAVSDMMIETMSKLETSGSVVSIVNGREEQREIISRAPGTAIIVRKLFNNVPVRKKFLSSSQSESRKIVNTITRIAFSFPEVAFTLQSEKGEVLSLPAGTMEDRAREIFGNSLFLDMIPVSYETRDFKMVGYIGSPENLRGNRAQQFFYLNRRNIFCPMLSRALERACNTIQTGKFPIGVLFIEMDSIDFDANVHPAKKEIRFLSENRVFKSVFYGIQRSLEKSFGAPGLDLKKPDFGPINDDNYAGPSFHYKNDLSILPGQLADKSESNTQTDLFPARNISKEDNVKLWPVEVGGGGGGINESDAEYDIQTLAAIPYIQLHQAYILFEVKSGLMMVNQQYAHERVLYEEVMDILNNRGKLLSQQLLFPEIVDVDQESVLVLNNNMNLLKSLGFQLENFGNNTFQIRGIPVDVKHANAKNILLDLLNTLGSGSFNKGDILGVLSKAFSACAGIKAGEKLEYAQMASLIDKLFATQNPYFAPSGRKIIVCIKIDEIRDRFGFRKIRD